MRKRSWSRTLVATMAMASTMTSAVVVGTATAASADPDCVDRGAYVLFARGSGSSFDSKQAWAFQTKIKDALNARGIANVGWAELGNLDGQPGIDNKANDPGEYPAVSVADWPGLRMIDNPWVTSYGQSVTTGKNELVTHLNDRYAGDGPRGRGSCYNETLVLGGYSQGADVVGWALRSSELSQAAKDHIGFTALYGDPKFDPGSMRDRFNGINFQSNWWWVRGNDAGYRITGWGPLSNSGFLGARDPYVPEGFKGRFGSWCASGDAFCSGIFPQGIGVHSDAYHGDNGWIAKSAGEIAYVAKQKHDRLVQGNTNSSGITTNVTSAPDSADPLYYDANMNPVPPPKPVITHLKRTLGPDSSRQVYASTKFSVTEAYWQPGGDGVHTHEIIHISQGDIVGFDKVNLPEGKQAMFTAVSDGVWESHWQSGQEVQSAKIISGLSGVKQIIADNRQESQGYTHRLYVLASDGPHEYWWRDGGDGIHHRLLDNISNPVIMASSTGPDGAYELFVATPTWVYQLHWFPGGTVNHRNVINITQGDIRSLSMGDNINGGQLLYVGTSTTAWQVWWPGTNGPISIGTIATGQTNAIQVQKTVTNGAHQLYLATNDHVQEYWWNGPNSGGSELIRISQGNITAIDKSSDGAYQQLYTGTANGDVWETYWGNGQGPVSKVLFRVER